MNLYPEVPEYYLDNPSARKYPQWDHSRAIDQRFKDRTVERLLQLLQQEDMSLTCSRRILSLVQDLQQLEREQD